MASSSLNCFPKELTKMFQADKCLLCDVSLSTEQFKMSHYEGKFHQKQVTAYMKRFHLPIKKEKETRTDKFKVVRCESCDILLTSFVVFKQHCEGKPHKKKVFKLLKDKIEKKIINENIEEEEEEEGMNFFQIPPPPSPPKLRDDFCNLCRGVCIKSVHKLKEKQEINSEERSPDCFVGDGQCQSSTVEEEDLEEEHEKTESSTKALLLFKKYKAYVDALSRKMNTPVAPKKPESMKRKIAKNVPKTGTWLPDIQDASSILRSMVIQLKKKQCPEDESLNEWEQNQKLIEASQSSTLRSNIENQSNTLKTHQERTFQETQRKKRTKKCHKHRTEKRRRKHSDESKSVKRNHMTEHAKKPKSKHHTHNHHSKPHDNKHKITDESRSHGERSLKRHHSEHSVNHHHKHKVHSCTKRHKNTKNVDK